MFNFRVWLVRVDAVDIQGAAADVSDSGTLTIIDDVGLIVAAFGPNQWEQMAREEIKESKAA